MKDRSSCSNITGMDKNMRGRIIADKMITDKKIEDKTISELAISLLHSSMVIPLPAKVLSFFLNSRVSPHLWKYKFESRKV